LTSVDVSPSTFLLFRLNTWIPLPLSLLFLLPLTQVSIGPDMDPTVQSETGADQEESEVGSDPITDLPETTITKGINDTYQSDDANFTLVSADEYEFKVHKYHLMSARYIS
jgi:hypothetical protein